MQNLLLFPYRARYVGWMLFIPAAILGLFTMRDDEFEFSFLTFYLPADWLLSEPFRMGGDLAPHPVNFTNELAALGCIAGLLLIAFSRERIDDEMISHLRLKALQWSVLVNYGILALLIVLVHGTGFMYVLTYNLFTVLLVFIGRMRWLLYRHAEPTLAL